MALKRTSGIAWSTLGFTLILGSMMIAGCGGNEGSGEAGSGGSGSFDGASQGGAAAITGDPSKVVASVDGDEITLKQVSRVVSGWRQGRAPDVNPSAPEAELQTRAIDFLVEQRLLSAAADASDLVPTSEDLDASYQQVRSQFPTEEQFKTALSMQGLTEEEFAQGFRQDVKIQYFVQKKFFETITITDEEAKTYFESHPEEFQSPAQMKASHILIRVAPTATPDEDAAARSKAESALARARSGEDFAALAREVSEDETTAPNGGDLGFFGPGMMVPPFDQAVFAMSPGDVSDIVKTQFGYHIIHAVDRQEPQPMEYMDVEPRLKQYLVQQQASEDLQVYLDELRAAADIDRDI